MKCHCQCIADVHIYMRAPVYNREWYESRIHGSLLREAMQSARLHW